MICIIATIQYTITLYIQVGIVLVLQKVENIIGNHTHVCSYHAVILVMQYNSYDIKINYFLDIKINYFTAL